MTSNIDYIPGNIAWITQRFKPVYDGTVTEPIATVTELTSESGLVLTSENNVILISGQSTGTAPIGVLIRFD